MKEVLAELSEKKIVSVSSFTETSARQLGLQEPCVYVLLEKSLLIIGTNTGDIHCRINVGPSLSTTTTPGKKGKGASSSAASASDSNVSILSCTYLQEVSSFVLALSDSSVVKVAVNEEKEKNRLLSLIQLGKDYPHTAFSSQPSRVLSANEDNLSGSNSQACVVQCADGSVAVMNFKAGANTDSGVHVKSAGGSLGGELVDMCCSGGGTVSALIKPKGGKKSASSVNTPKGSKKRELDSDADSSDGILMLTWRLADSSAGLYWLCGDKTSEKGGSQAPLSSVSVLGADGDSRMLGGKCCTLMLMAQSWGKFSASGQLLYQRPYASGGGASAVQADGGNLWLLAGEELQAFDTRYGVLQSTCVAAIGSSGGGASAKKRSKGSAINGGSGGSENREIYTIIPSKRAPVVVQATSTAQGSVLHAHTLASLPQASTEPGSLASAVGALKSASSDDTEEEEVGSDFSKGVLNTLPRAYRRRLQAISGATEGVDDKADTEVSETGGELPRLFLRQLQRVPVDECSKILASDWQVVGSLLRSPSFGCVSVNFPNNSSLIAQALQAERYDVLCAVARYAADLTAAQAVQAMAALLSITGATAASAPKSAKKGSKSPKGKEQKSDSSSISKLAMFTVNATGMLVWGSSKDKEKNKEEGDKRAVVVPAGEVTPLSVIRIFCECLVRRKGAFSSLLLSEAVRVHMPTPTAGMFFLRVFVYFLRGVSPEQALYDPEASKEKAGQMQAHSASEPQMFGFFHDAQLRRAISWAEAIVDAFFCSSALSVAMGGEDGIAAIVKQAARIIAPHKIAECGRAAELALGGWTHVQRTIKSNKERGIDPSRAGSALTPPTGLYRLEKVSF